MFKCYLCDLYMIKPQLEKKQGLYTNPDLCQIPVQDGTESALECMQCLCFHVQWEVDEKGEEETSRRCCNANEMGA